MNDKINNNTDDKAAENQNQQGKVSIISQYIKDLSFENPHAVSVMKLQKQPTLTINVEVKADNIDKNLHEVTLNITVNSAIEGQTAYILQLSYCALLEHNDIPKDRLGLLLLVETPQILFPFARRIVSDAITDGGYPPVMLEPINFYGLYQNEAQKQGKKVN